MYPSSKLDIQIDLVYDRQGSRAWLALLTLLILHGTGTKIYPIIQF